MSVRSKSKVSAIFRRLFGSSNGTKDEEKASSSSSSSSSSTTNNNNNNNININSPARRLLRGCRDSVAPLSLDAVSSPTSTSSPKSVKKKTKNETVRTRRLMKEFRDLQRLQTSRNDPIFSVELVEDNLFEWHVKLYKIDEESPLGTDMRELGIGHILLDLLFPENFPFAPPFMRVIAPRIEKGFVMEGGAICMELLTPRGWASAYTVEAILMQFAASVVKGQGRVQRKTKGHKTFNKRAAEDSFRSLVKTHDKYGWVTPSLADG